MLKFLGRGSAFNVKEGNTSGYYIDSSTMFLFDCGEDVFKKVIPLLNNVDNLCVFITHLNSDHVGSLSSLLFYLKYKTKIRYEVYVDNGLYNDLVNLLELNGNIEQINCIKLVEGIEVSHIKGMNCFGYLLRYKAHNKTLYYSGDSNDIPEFVLSKLGEIDYIYQDTCLADYEGNVHLSLRKLCELIPIEHRHKVWCMHLDCDELIGKAKVEGFNVVEVDYNA